MLGWLWLSLCYTRVNPHTWSPGSAEPPRSPALAFAVVIIQFGGILGDSQEPLDPLLRSAPGLPKWVLQLRVHPNPQGSPFPGYLQSPPVQKLRNSEISIDFSVLRSPFTLISPCLQVIGEDLDFPSDITSSWLPRDKKLGIEKHFPILHPGKAPAIPRPKPCSPQTLLFRRVPNPPGKFPSVAQVSPWRGLCSPGLIFHCSWGNIQCWMEGKMMDCIRTRGGSGAREEMDPG